MQVKSFAECSTGSILQYLRPSLSYHLSLRSLFCLFLSGRLRQVLLNIALWKLPLVLNGLKVFFLLFREEKQEQLSDLSDELGEQKSLATKLRNEVCYNQATSNRAIYSQETSQDKLSEASNRQSIIVIQVHDKLHEKLFISTFSYL